MIGHKRLLFGALLLLVCVLASLAHVSVASAMALNPDPGASALPTYHRNYLEAADNHVFSPTITQWISPAGQSGATSMTVPYGTQTVDLELHYAGAVGWKPSSTTDSQMNITAVSQGVDAGLVGQSVSFSLYPNQNVPGTFGWGGRGFQYTNPTPFTQSVHVDISITAKMVNKFIKSDGTFYYLCVGNAKSTSDITGGSCPDTIQVFGIDITVESLRTYMDQADCRGIVGWAVDLSQLGNQIPIHVYVGGPAGSGAPGYPFTTDVFRQGVNDAFPGATGPHGFSITHIGGQTIENIAKNGPVTFYIYALGQYEISLVGAPTISACPPKATYDGLQVNNTGMCRFWGWAFDPSLGEQSLYLDVWIGPPLPPNAPRTAVPSRRFHKADKPRGDVNIAFGITGNHGFEIDVPNQYRDGKPHSVEIWAYGIDPDGFDNGLNAEAVGTPANFVCPIIPICGTLSTSPNPPQPNQSFTIQANAQTSATAPPPSGMTFTINVNIPGIYNGPLTPQGLIPAGSTLSNPPPPSSPSIPGKALGQYKGGLPGNNAYTITLSNGQSTTCPGEVDVTARPFFSVTQGDIGSGFSSGLACSNGWAAADANNSKLISWYDTATNRGSGTALAVVALSKIDGVASYLPNNPPAKQLSFSNASSAGTFGGLYTGTMSCPKDFYKYHTGTPTPPAASTISVPVSDVDATTDITLTGGSLGGATRSVLYTTGNVYITQNITLNNNVNDPSLLANFYVVAKGNIYIAPGVTKLEGVYIAQGSGATGQIYTCAQPFAPPTADMLDKDNGSCRNNAQLTVNGAFIADKVNLYRSFGTLSQNNNPAEIFNYAPAVWLAPPKSIAPAFTGGDGTANKKSYDAITTLQPVL